MKVIVFDLDGTLIDSAPDIHKAANAVLGAEGAPPISLEQARGFIGNGAGVLIERVMQVRDMGTDSSLHKRMLDAFLELYEEAVYETVLYPGVPEALAGFQAGGWRMGLCTNKPLGPTRAVLAHFGLLDAFGAILGGDSLPQRKPDPAPLRAVVAALGGGPSVYVGDSEVDAETAQAADLPFAIFTEGYRKTPLAELPHDASFGHFDDLPAIAARLLHGKAA